MKMLGIHHVGVAVEDLDGVLALLVDGLGMQRGEELDREDLVARFLKAGTGTVEVLHVRDEDARRERLGGVGVTAKIDHIAIEVDDIEDTVALLTRLGIETTGAPRESMGALTVWTRASTSGGIGFQFLQPNDAALGS